MILSDEITIKIIGIHDNLFYYFFYMNMKNTTSTKGFTLVELIVVIVILAILATIAFLSFSSQSASARDSKRKTDLSNIASKINIGAANGSALTSFVSGAANRLAS
jgi:prepilin-type N-terminal cleavage/methylation domain-containing protein